MNGGFRYSETHPTLATKNSSYPKIYASVLKFFKETNMQAIEFKTIMKNGWLKVPHYYPDLENQSVKVIVLLPAVEPKISTTTQDNRYPLRGTHYHYDEPFTQAVPAEDWEVLK